MTGYHTVKVFRVPVGQEVDLPPGYKPFAVIYGPPGAVYVVTRKWERVEG